MFRNTFLILVLSLGTLTSGLTQDVTNSSLDSALEGLGKGDRDSAITTLDSIWLDHHETLDPGRLELPRKIARRYRELHAHHKSIIIYESMYRMAERVKDTNLLCESLYYQGLGYRSMGLFNEALERLFHCLSLEDMTTSSNWTRVALIQVGIIKKEQGLLRESIKHFEQALDIAKEHENKNGIASILNNLGSAYKQLGEYALAKEYLQEAIELNKASGNLKYLSYNYNNLANVYEETNLLENALTYQNKSIEYKVQLEDEASLGVSYLNKAIILNKLNRTNDALGLLDQSLRLAEKYDQAALIPHIYEELAEVYVSIEKPQKAYDYMVASVSSKDSIAEADKKAVISQMEAFYHQRKIEAENNSLKKTVESGTVELRRRDTLLFSLFVIIAILLILVSAYVIANRKRVLEAKEYKEQFEALREKSLKLQDQSHQIEMSTNRLEQLRNDNDLYLTTLRSDVRGLVSALNALLSVLQQNNQDPELNDKISLLAFSSENLMWLIENILEFDSELNESIAPTKPLNLKIALEGICSNFQKLFKEKGIDFIVVLNLTEKTQRIDANRIHQVTFSLLDSAFKLTKHGYVNFEASEIEGSVVMNLECSNQEIPAGFLKRVFNRFYLTSEENYKILGGSGLNLYMINKIAEQNNWPFETAQHRERLQFKLTLPLNIPTPVESM